MRQRQFLRNIGLLLCSLLTILALGITQAQDSGPVLRIGVIDDERGSIANGARLAVRELNSEGGVVAPDGTQFRLELIVRGTDLGFNLADAVDAIANADIIAVLGPETTETVLSNLPVLQSLGVPVLTPAIGDTVVASDTTGQVFRTRAAERFLANALADYLIMDLNVDRLTTVQLDRRSTASRVAFSFALGQRQNAPDEETAFLESEEEMADLITEIIADNPPAVVLFADPALAAPFYTQLREGGWVGTLVYDQARNPLFFENVPLSQLSGITSPATWSPAALDIASTGFVLNFVRLFGYAPGPIEAAGYDSINLIAAAIREEGDLEQNLVRVREIPGVQGVLNPMTLTEQRGETSNNVFILELNPFGGARVVARYAGNERLTPDRVEVVVDEGTPTPTLTATPEGLVVTIQSAVQNVRTGPGLEYDILAQLRQGEQFRVIGATQDFSWVVIDYRGQQGWLAAYLLDIFGDRASVPVVAIPPTPTPGPATSTPTPPAIPDIVIVSVAPSTITRNIATEVIVRVRNQGGGPAGPFAVAATFPPSDTYSARNLDGLAAGAETTVNLPVTLTGPTGLYEVAIVADLNQQVNEGPTGEANNTFSFSYKLDQILFLINSTTLGSGSSIDLDPGLATTPDLQYTGAGLQTVGTCDGSRNCIGLISPAQTWETAHYGAITSANGVNAGFISNAALQPGAAIGVLTQDGLRGVLRIDAIQPGVSITFTYRIYQNA